MYNHGHDFAGVSESESVYAVALKLPAEQVVFQLFEMVLPLSCAIVRSIMHSAAVNQETGLAITRIFPPSPDPYMDEHSPKDHQPMGGFARFAKPCQN